MAMFYKQVQVLIIKIFIWKLNDLNYKESDFAYKNIPNYSLKFSEENKEECLEIFYKNSDSFSANNGQLNFNGN